MKRLILTLASFAAAPIMAAAMLARIFRSRATLSRAGVLVVLPHVGFGHTITAPDIARRLYKGRRPVALLFSETRYHNPLIDEIWPDIDCITVPLSLRITDSLRLPWAEPVKEFLRLLVIRVARFLMLSDSESIGVLEMYDLLVPTDVTCPPRGKVPQQSLLWPIGYFRLQANVKAPKVHLSSDMRAQVRSRLSRKTLCNLYLRQKDDISADLANSRRSGSPLSSYVPAIRHLIDSGYQVLLTGDQSLPDSLYAEFAGMLTDAAHAQTAKNIFDVFAATEADICVAEPGGGAWLPGVNEIPRLLINAFPYFYSLANSWLYYKVAVDSDHRPIPYEKLFADHPHDYELKGWTLLNNSADQILSAVVSFLEEIRNPKPDALTLETFAELPDYLWIRHGSAHILPVWLKVFEQQRVYS